MLSCASLALGAAAPRQAQAHRFLRQGSSPYSSLRSSCHRAARSNSVIRLSLQYHPTQPSEPTVAAQPLVLGPIVQEDSTNPPFGTPHALLLILPGGLLGPADYARLSKAVQDEAGAKKSVVVWSAVAAINWLAVGADPEAALTSSHLVEVAVQEAVHAAEEQGFQPMRASSGRIDNLFVACHSYSAAWAGMQPLLGRAAGMIILASGLVPLPGVWPSVYEFPRPIMHISGQLDGQWRVTKAALTALEAAEAAVQLGPRYMAQTRPIAVIPGMNHAHLTASPCDTGRGDIPSNTPLEAILPIIAELMVAFVEANHPDTSREAVRPAVERLLCATQDAVALLSPYTEALGLGSLTNILSSNEEGRGLAVGSHSPLLQAVGASALPFSFQNKEFFAHPGELAAAEEFCRSVQLRMLGRGLPAAALSNVQVIATVHTSLEAFTYSQPTVFKLETAAGVKIAVHAHCYLYRESLGRNPMLYRKPLSPQYFMKLRKPGVVAHVLGLVIEEAFEHNMAGAELNEELYKKALRQVAPLALETFKRQGRVLTFAPDRDVTHEVESPVEWMAMDQSLIHDPPSNAVRLASPCFSTPSKQLPHYDRGPGRFWGNHYIKCMSLAWMHEWIMVDGLRVGGG